MSFLVLTTLFYLRKYYFILKQYDVQKYHCLCFVPKIFPIHLYIIINSCLHYLLVGDFCRRYVLFVVGFYLRLFWHVVAFWFSKYVFYFSKRRYVKAFDKLVETQRNSSELGKPQWTRDLRNGWGYPPKELMVCIYPKDSTEMVLHLTYIPTGSMYGICTRLPLKKNTNQNVGKYTSPMDPSWDMAIWTILYHTWRLWAFLYYDAQLLPRNLEEGQVFSGSGAGRCFLVASGARGADTTCRACEYTEALTRVFVIMTDCRLYGKQLLLLIFHQVETLQIQLPRIMLHEKSLVFTSFFPIIFQFTLLNMPNNSQPTVYGWEFLSFAFWGCLGFAPRVCELWSWCVWQFA